jgi:hypothetical protein
MGESELGLRGTDDHVAEEDTEVAQDSPESCRMQDTL